MYKYFIKIGSTEHISKWKSKGLSSEIIKPPATSDNNLCPALSYFGTKTRVKFTIINNKIINNVGIKTSVM